MDTKIEITSESNIDRGIIKEAAEVIKKGDVVAFPTETVYGLGANALDERAVEKIFLAKGRPQDNPLIMHVANYDIESYVEFIPEKAITLMKRYWPGPLTLIFKKTSLVPHITSAGLETIGIRMPANNIALELIREAGVPIAAPSANISGRPSPTKVQHCIEDLKGIVPFILGGEDSEVGVESTIVDCTGDTLCVLRPGGITLEMLREVDPKIYIDPAVMSSTKEDFKPKAPGMKYRHYAPKAPVKIVEGELQKTVEKINEIVQNYINDNKSVGIMATEETKHFYTKGDVVSLGSREDIETIGRNLFNVLRSFDEKEVDVILSEAFEDEGVGTAIMNRLRKSSGFNIIKV